ncbi:hypothetical protein C8R44DRAFT_875908 [Mycena epipterygia]|nr:hypothetical protein C8R44DRAFT_875908 [Mycena epipterygia]
MDHPTAALSNLSAYKSALVLIPPRKFAERLNPFRLVHDKSAPRWSAHITLHFSFVEVPSFPDVVATIERRISQMKPFSFKFDHVGSFALQGYETVHLGTSDDANLKELYSIITEEMSFSAGRPFTPHLTVGQASHASPGAIESLRRKAQGLLESVSSLEWPVQSVVFLRKDDNDGGVMKRCHEVFLAGQSQTTFDIPPWHPTVCHDGNQWKFCDSPEKDALPSNVSVATYNVLHDDLFPTPERLPAVIQTILSSDADIICLQEVTDDSLAPILSSLSISSRFPYSNRHPSIVLENERNILILSRFPFSWSKLDVGGKHKPAILASFTNSTGGHLIVAAVHLTAGRTGSYLSQKTAEMSSLVSHLQENYSKADWIIAGDTNWPETEHSTPADELFEDAGLTVPHGPTYDPDKNHLASVTVRHSTEPQRYDRIYVKREGDWSVAETRLFGDGPDPASDHYGLCVALRPRIDAEVPSAEDSGTTPATLYPLPPTGNLTTQELLELAEARSWLPSAEYETKMSAVVPLLRTVLCPPTTADSSSASNVQIHIECIGSYALGVHTCDSDVDCLAVGNVSSTTFWELARARIRSVMAKGMDIKLRRFVKDANVQSMDLEVGGVRVDMQYCPARNLTGSEWKNLGSIPSDSPLFHLPASSLVTLNAYRDVLTLLKILPSLSNFRTAHRSLKLFLTSQGLFGARFGFLGGFHLTLLLTRVAMMLPREAKPHQIVRQFFATYGGWDWERDLVWPIPSREPRTGSGYRRVLAKEPMVVLSIERPISNLTFHASRNSVEVMSVAFKKADRMLEDGKSWAEVCGLKETQEVPYKVFLRGHKIYIKLDVHFWGGSNLKGRAVIGWLESRLVSLLVQLRSAAPGINARFWPKRFTGSANANVDAHDPNGFYLFGLSPSLSSATSSDDPSKLSQKNAEAESALARCLRSFEAELQGNTKFYDPSNTFISLNLVKGSLLPPNTVPDAFTWSDNGVDPVEDDEDEEEEPMSDSGSGGDNAGSKRSKKNEQVLSASQKKKAIAAKAKTTSHTPAASKLRTSADVMNRLLWDSTISQDEHVVGYEDRFLGIKESPLSNWILKEVEHESFIPQHRIIYFKRVTDGEIVWDRRKKIDLIFGSGLGAG